jgi:hypothetical protein
MSVLPLSRASVAQVCRNEYKILAQSVRPAFDNRKRHGTELRRLVRALGHRAVYVRELLGSS